MVEKIKTNKLTSLAYGGLIIAIFSALTPIVSYTNSRGIHRSFSLLDFILPRGGGFDQFVSYEYTGTVYWYIDIGIIHIFTVIAIAAIICSFYGVKKISNQTENKQSIMLTVLGFIGTMAPAILILICIVLLGGEFKGEIHCGIYPIVSPIAMVVCIVASTRMHQKNIEYRRKLNDAAGLIRRGSDL